MMIPTFIFFLSSLKKRHLKVSPSTTFRAVVDEVLLTKRKKIKREKEKRLNVYSYILDPFFLREKKQDSTIFYIPTNLDRSLIDWWDRARSLSLKELSLTGFCYPLPCVAWKIESCPTTRCSRFHG